MTRAFPHSLLQLACALVAIGLAFGSMAIWMHPLPQVDVPLSVHALVEHGQDAATAKQCLEGREGFLFFNPQSQRWAIVCWLGDRWGIVILTAAWAIITAYVCTKLKNGKRVEEYFRRQGYLEKP
jgi:hypothetical protein